MLQAAPRLADQIHDTIVDEICVGRAGEAESVARLALAHAEDAATRLGGILEASARCAAEEG